MDIVELLGDPDRGVGRLERVELAEDDSLAGLLPEHRGPTGCWN